MNSTPSVPAKAHTRINLSVKFVGRYVPPPKPKAARRKSTLRQVVSRVNIQEEDDELMDEILDDEENVFSGVKPFGNISEIKPDGSNESAAYSRMISEESADTTFSMGQLARMTTIRRVFEEFKVDI